MVPQADLERYLKVLLRRGFDGGFAVIRQRSSGVFLQFSKYVIDGRAGIQLDFPLAPWSRDYFDKLRKLLEEQGLAYGRSPGSGGEVKEFLEVDFGNDVRRAAVLARLVLGELFRVADDEEVELVFEGVSPHEERIGS